MVSVSHMKNNKVIIFVSGLSTKRVVYHKGLICCFGWSHSVPKDHPQSLEKLLRDCCFVTKTLYLSTERPVVTYLSPKHFSFFNFSTVRYGRRNPVYYVDMHYTTLFLADNRLTVEFWFYEYYNSQYRRSFLEMSFKWCNLVYHDNFFGPALRKNLPKSCPHYPDTYHLQNMTLAIEALPEFPFTKGRIYANVTWKQDIAVGGYIDVELKRKKLA